MSDLGHNSLTWLGANTTFELGNWRLPEPLAYFSSGSCPEDDASCIDVRLPTGRPMQEIAGALGYWPRYRLMSPEQRANYLAWLASGRTAPLNDIGYVFVFFYGLERRTLVDGQDLYPILSEVVRLLERYPSSNSFNGYSRGFIAFSLARAGLDTLSESWFSYLVEKPALPETEAGRAVALGWMYQKERPLPAPFAQQIAAQDPLAQRSVVLDRVREQFDTLFAEKYRTRFGDGIVLKAAKRALSLPYHPGSPTLLTSRSAADHLTAHIPHVLGIHSQFKPLIALWNECVEELRPLSRQVGKGVSVNSRAAYDALPEALKKTTEHPDARRWQQVAARHARPGGLAVVPAAELAALLGTERGAKLTVRQSQELAQVAQDVGFAIEPDARRTRRAYGVEDGMALFRLEGDASTAAEQGTYPAAALILELGLAMAAADGAVDPEEVSIVASFIESQFELALPEARRLEALKTLLVDRPPSLAGIGRRMQELLNEEQRTALAHLLIGVAAANGTVDRSEVSALRKLGRALGIDTGRLEALICDLLGLGDEPVEVQRGASGRAGEAIPARRSEGESTKVVLNEEVLRSILQETQDVARMLTEAMGEEADLLDVLPDAESDSALEFMGVARAEPPNDDRFDGLDRRYHKIAVEILTRESWARADFETLVRGHGLFPAGTMDIINEWAEERLGDMLLEDGNPLRVKRELIEQ